MHNFFYAEQIESKPRREGYLGACYRSLCWNWRLSLGLKLAGIDVVASYEWWQPAIDTHNGNLGDNVVSRYPQTGTIRPSHGYRLGRRKPSLYRVLVPKPRVQWELGRAPRPGAVPGSRRAREAPPLGLRGMSHASPTCSPSGSVPRTTRCTASKTWLQIKIVDSRITAHRSRGAALHRRQCAL